LFVGVPARTFTLSARLALEETNMKRILAPVMSVLIAMLTCAQTSTPAQAHYRHGGDGAIAAGVALAIIGGIALSRHHHHRYYGYYDDGYGYYDSYPRYYGRSYYGGSRSYGGGYAVRSYHGGGGHHHHHR
jgi:hypothetical protein